MGISQSLFNIADSSFNIVFCFRFLESKKDEIEREVGLNLDWRELPGKKASRIRAEISGLIDNTEEWEKYFAWMLETGEKFQKAFSKALKKYKE